MKPLRLLDDVRRRVLVHRRLLGSLCAALTVWIVVQAATAPPPAIVPVWTPARALPSGTVLGSDDFTRTGYAPGSVPVGAVRSLTGVGGPTRAPPPGVREPITAADLAGSE